VDGRSWRLVEAVALEAAMTAMEAEVEAVLGGCRAADGDMWWPQCQRKLTVAEVSSCSDRPWQQHCAQGRPIVAARG